MLEIKSPPSTLRRAESLHADAVEASGEPKLKVLWVFDVDYRYGIEHGGHLRVFNYAKELLSQGHEVYFGVCRNKWEDPGEKKKYLEELKRRGLLTDYVEVEYRHPRLRGKLAQLARHPALSNTVLRAARRPIEAAFTNFIDARGINLCILADRRLLFVLPRIRDRVATIVDWTDSYVLYRTREMRLQLKKRQFGEVLRSLRYLTDEFISESYYGKRAAANVVVSPVDKKCLDRVNNAAHKNRVLLNGVSMQAGAAHVDKVAGRIIFTGNMNFPPNYESAIWFIDRVLPRLLESKGDARLVVAGGSPIEQLRARAGERVEVTGFVEDMGLEIAKSELYVAPLVCGGGFKNKVVEAIRSGTFVVATSMAVEFLSAEIRNLLLVADTPEEMVESILAFFAEPRKYNERLERLNQLLGEEFSWRSRTKELVEIAREVLAAK